LALFGSEELVQASREPKTVPKVAASRPPAEPVPLVVTKRPDLAAAPPPAQDSAFDRIMHLTVESACPVESSVEKDSTRIAHFRALVVGEGGELLAEMASAGHSCSGELAEAFSLLAALRENADLAGKSAQLIKATLPPRLHGAVKALLPGYLRQGFLDDDQAPVLERLGPDFMNPVPSHARPHLRELAELLGKVPLVVNW